MRSRDELSVVLGQGGINQRGGHQWRNSTDRWLASKWGVSASSSTFSFRLVTPMHLFNDFHWGREEEAVGKWKGKKEKKKSKKIVPTA